MKEEIKDKIIAIFVNNHGCSSTSAITEAGIHHKYLHILEDEGIIEKVKRGLYILTEQRNESTFYETMNIVPGGIICLASALSYYQLTSYEPLSTEIAIRNKRKIILPENPPIHLYYFSKTRYEEGISIQEINGKKFKIYDKEKTICDLIFYRNKIGKDIVQEVLSNYVKSRDKNISKLFEYSRKLRVYKLVQQYLDVLV